MLLTSATMWAQAPQIGGCPVFPPDHIWNTPVKNLPVHARSDDYVRTIGETTRLHPDFGSGEWGGVRPGIPYVVARADEQKVAVKLEVPQESDPGPFPIPAAAPIEGDPRPKEGSDRHVLVVDSGACRLIELIGAFRQGDGTWKAAAAAVFPLRSYELRTARWTSADAAGLPILPGLVRYEEVMAGRIAHALRFTARSTHGSFVWPARHRASLQTDPRLPPMGQRFRLKASTSLAGFSREARIILEALQTYGMMLADHGGPWFLSGATDSRWNNTVLDELKKLHGSDFEAVDVSSLMISPDSGRAARQ